MNPGSNRAGEEAGDISGRLGGDPATAPGGGSADQADRPGEGDLEDLVNQDDDTRLAGRVRRYRHLGVPSHRRLLPAVPRPAGGVGRVSPGTRKRLKNRLAGRRGSHRARRSKLVPATGLCGTVTRLPPGRPACSALAAAQARHRRPDPTCEMTPRGRTSPALCSSCPATIPRSLSCASAHAFTLLKGTSEASWRG